MRLDKKFSQNHFYFISLIAIHYLISLIFTGHVIVEPFDMLDGVVVNDHIIAKIYKGNIDSISYFLAGEIKWYYLEKLFYPTNILHYVLNDKLFYFTNDILKKLIAYFAFYYLAKSLLISRFHSALGGVLYSTIIFDSINTGLAIPFLPYILYLLLNKKTLDKKHYFFLFLIGLNSSLIHDIFAFIFLVPLAFILNDKKKNLIIHLQIFSVIFLSSLLSDLHLIIGSIFSDPIHREARNAGVDLIFPFVKIFKDFFTYIDPKNPLFIFYIPLVVLTTSVFILSPFSKQKSIRLIFFFIILVLILKSLLNPTIMNNILVGIFDLFKGYNFQRVDKIIPITLALLFVLLINNLENIKIKKIFYFLSLVAVVFIQLKTPLPVITQHLLKENMHMEKFKKTKSNFLDRKYNQFFKIILDKESYKSNKKYFNSPINKTFDGYYKFKDYSFIRVIVKDSRVMSVGLDPMVAVMNDIKVIDGYHTIYPLSYKIKFRNIIEKELEKNVDLKNYYDNWGNRVYAFYNDENNILLNFKFAKNLGADYIISKFPITNNKLKIECFNCNNSDEIFLYRIL